MRESLVRSIEQLGNLFNSFLETIVNIFSYIISIFGFLFYAGKTLIVGVFKLIGNVFGGGVFASVFSALDDIAFYIGAPATIFICALFFVVVIRILVAFVFKILRLNMDYTTMKTDWKNKQQEDKGKAFREKYGDFV